jgi:hypothetical protein
MIVGMKARTRWIAATALLSLAAGGCTAEPKPNTSTATPTATATGSPRSTTPAADPTPTVPADVPTTGTNLLAKREQPPVMPAIALQHTDAGAMAFAKFYLQTVDWGYATTNASYMRHYYDKDCVRCKILDDAITSVQRAKQKFIGGRSHITRVDSFAAKTNGSDLVVDTIVDRHSG